MQEQTQAASEDLYSLVSERLLAGEDPETVADSLGLDTASHDRSEDQIWDGLAIVLPGWTADDGNAEVEYPAADDGDEAAREYVEDGDWGECESTDWIEVTAWRVALVLRTCEDYDEPEVSADAVRELVHALLPDGGAHVVDAGDYGQVVRVWATHEQQRALARLEIPDGGSDWDVVYGGYSMHLRDSVLVRARWHRPYVEEVMIDREQHTVNLDPPEPECAGDEHEWRSPLSVVGGIESNPGVWAHGGGVLIREVCRHCGRYRETDTWAQCPTTGAQGLRSVTYKDADGDSLAWVAGGGLRAPRRLRARARPPAARRTTHDRHRHPAPDRR